MTLDSAPEGEFIARMTPLFEGAPRFLLRLAGARPFGWDGRLFNRALEIALAMPEEEKIELVNAHPRLGAPADSVSAMSHREQGYDRLPDEVSDLAAQLAELNDAYEARFGFRYCVFVAGRSGEELLPDFRAAMGKNHDGELRRALHAVVDIARDRFAKLAPEGTPR